MRRVRGPSGAGKTTLLRLITHETAPTSGTVTVGTFRGGRLPRAQRALLRRTLGIIYEDFRLLNDRTVFENVALAVRITGRFRDDEVIPRTLYALEEVGLHDKQAAFPPSCRPARSSAPHRPRHREPPRRDPGRRAHRRARAASATEVHGPAQAHPPEGAALLIVTTRADVADAIGGRLLRLDDGRRGAAPAGPLAVAPRRPATRRPRRRAGRLTVHLYFLREAWRSFRQHQGLRGPP